MFRMGNICTIAGLVATAALAGGASTLPGGAIPDFAPDDNTGWVPARAAGNEFRRPEQGPGKVLQATVTVDDPAAFNTPWTAVQRWKHGESRPFEEDARAENNYSFLNYDVVPIPEARAADF